MSHFKPEPPEPELTFPISEKPEGAHFYFRDSWWRFNEGKNQFYMHINGDWTFYSATPRFKAELLNARAA